MRLLIRIGIVFLLLGLWAGYGRVEGQNEQRMREPELMAMRTLQSIQTAQSTYYSRFNRYAVSLEELGPGADLIPAWLASGSHQGYRFAMTGDAAAFRALAAPEAFGRTGSRSFYLDQTGVLRDSRTAATATSASPEVP